MEEQAQRKNQYLLETLQKEFPTFAVVSFDIFDTLLLRDVLFPQDILKILSRWAWEQYQIADFLYLRTSLEEDARRGSGKEDVSLIEIYRRISQHNPKWPVEVLREKEVALELEHIRPNPYVKQLYEEVQQLGKPVWLISDMYLPEGVIREMLTRCGYTGTFNLWISGAEGLAKSTSNLYRRIQEQTGISSAQWIHIGDDGYSDLTVPHTLGIKTGYVRCPRDWYFLKREQEHQLAEKAAGKSLPPPPWDDSVEMSMSIAKEINEVYTRCSPIAAAPMIEADGVGMMFHLSSERVDNLKEYLIRRMKGELSYQEFWALKCISMTIHRGEKVGLVGLNGSGKSTLLKVLSGVLKPTNGRVSVYGSVAPLIELGAGFDSELSAKENIFLNGAILGYSRKEMKGLYDDIISFAELKDFENVAIKNFSSGMVARLGFAIATCQTPEILIIDEILSVGDFEFQKKCHDRMNVLTQAGTTVLFVSHSPDDIVRMCERAIWLENGEMVLDGEVQYVMDRYLSNEER